MVEEVFDGFDTAFGEVFRDALADALDEFDGGGELQGHGLMVATIVLPDGRPARAAVTS